VAGAILAAMLLVALVSMDAPFSVALPLSILFGLAGQHFASLALSAREDVFSPVTFIALYFTTDIAMRALYIVVFEPYAKRVGRIGYDDYIPNAIWCAVLAYVSFLIGFRSNWGKSLLRYLPKRSPRWPKSVPTIRIALLSSLGFLVMVYLFRHGVGVVGGQAGEGGAPANGVLDLLRQLLSVGWVASCVCLLTRDRTGNRRAAWLLVLLSLAYIVVRIGITGGKQALLEPLLAGAIVFHYLRKRLRLWQFVAMAAPAAFLAFGVINFYRFVTVREGGSPRSFADVADLASAAADTIGSDAGQSSAFEMMMDRQAGVDAVALVVKYTPNPQRFRHGDSFINALLAASVPRQLWPGKPIYNPSRDFEQNYMGMPRDFQGMSSPHLISDLYQNFGIVGVVAGMYLFGAFLKWFYLSCSPGPHNAVGVFFYGGLFLIFAHLMEAVIGTILVQFPRALLLSLLAALFIGVRFPKTTGRPLRIFLRSAGGRIDNSGVTSVPLA
jgi:hypothetical protein